MPKRPSATQMKHVEKQLLTRVIIPPICISIKCSENPNTGTSAYNGEGGTYGDLLLKTQGDSKFSVADKLRDLANTIASSEGLLKSATIFVLCNRR